ncbi:unnamed protein product [Durusdinium trenchii]|uniref:Serine/threonine-protein kinase nek3 n=2 Tax=Durusdinium trenchii TaxID=1381693 RepID=A0ABP0JXW5_9DINO
MPVAQSALAMADETSAWPLSAITDLSERIAACEQQLGVSPSSPSSAPAQPRAHARVAELKRKLDEIGKSSKLMPKLQELEHSMDQLEDWLHTEHAGASQILLHSSTKKSYVVQHAQQLQDFARQLKEVEALESYVNTPSLRELPAYGERLRAADAKSAVLVGSAMQLHEEVGRLAEDYYQAMTALNDQMSLWDQLLSDKIGTGV